MELPKREWKQQKKNKESMCVQTPIEGVQVTATVVATIQVVTITENKGK